MLYYDGGPECGGVDNVFGVRDVARLRSIKLLLLHLVGHLYYLLTIRMFLRILIIIPNMKLQENSSGMNASLSFRRI